MILKSTGYFKFDANLTHFLPKSDIPVLEAGVVGLAPKWVRLDPKFDKSGTFSDHISVHLAR